MYQIGCLSSQWPPWMFAGSLREPKDTNQSSKSLQITRTKVKIAVVSYWALLLPRGSAFYLVNSELGWLIFLTTDQIPIIKFFSLNQLNEKPNIWTWNWWNEIVWKKNKILTSKYFWSLADSRNRDPSLLVHSCLFLVLYVCF